MTLRRETFRLSRAFGALVLAVTPIAAAQACSEAAQPTEAPGADASPLDEVSSDGPAADSPAAEAAIPYDATCQVETRTLDAGPDVDPPCRYTLPCGFPTASAFVLRGCGLFLSDPPDGGDAALGCAIPQKDGCENGTYSQPANGSLSFECLDCLGGSGRRPRGLRRPPPVHARSGTGSYFARMAHGEAASVHAFARMHEELRQMGAPALLVEAAARSACDERRHARAMRRQATRRGAPIPVVRIRQPRARSLESIARENATEGCIRETFGALLMRWQAERAQDPALRRLFARIAADETRHAAFAWEVARWLEPRLDPRARARVSAARRRALRALGESVQARGERDFDGAIGQPCGTAAAALLAGLAAHLALA